MRRLALLLLVVSAGATAQVEATAARLEGRFVRALTALAVEDDSTALGLLDEILEAAPDDPTVLGLRAEVAADLDEPADAVYYARRAAEAAPESASAWLGLGSALRAADRPSEAADALTRARALAPDDLDVLTSLADLAAEQGDAALERDALADLVRLGDTVAARLRLSTLAERAGDRDEALAQARAAARLAPSEPAVARRIADLEGPPARTASSTDADGAAIFADGQYEEAADALLAELDADPRRVETWALVLQALARAADPRAGATADDALLLFSSVPAVLAGAAEAYAAAGRTDDARDAAQRGLDTLALLGDDLPEADALRARLDAVLSR